MPSPAADPPPAKTGDAEADREFGESEADRVLAALALHAFWNPPFFMRQAIEANVVDTINRHGLEAGTIKLPKVRALSGKEPKSAKKEAYPVATDSPKAKKRSD